MIGPLKFERVGMQKKRIARVLEKPAVCQGYLTPAAQFIGRGDSGSQGGTIQIV